MEQIRFHPIALQGLATLRQRQTLDLTGQVHDPLEERIALAEPACLRIESAANDIGYAVLDDKSEARIALLEFYLVPSHRRESKLIFDELVWSFHCSSWFVNSQDSFALPLLLDLGLPYELDGYLFSIAGTNCGDAKVPEEIALDRAAPDDLESTYDLIMQDGFYTGNGRRALAIRIENGEIYLLRSEGDLVGVGFVCPLARTPRYADIAMIIDSSHRRQGFAFHLVRQLIQISLAEGLIPTALTSVKNIASKRTLEKCGFHLDGCMLLANISRSS